MAGPQIDAHAWGNRYLELFTLEHQRRAAGRNLQEDHLRLRYRAISRRYAAMAALVMTEELDVGRSVSPQRPTPAMTILLAPEGSRFADFRIRTLGRLQILLALRRVVTHDRELANALITAPPDGASPIDDLQASVSSDVAISRLIAYSEGVTDRTIIGDAVANRIGSLPRPDDFDDSITVDHPADHPWIQKAWKVLSSPARTLEGPGSLPRISDTPSL